MKKKIAIALSDIHFHDWKQFNENGRRITAHLSVWDFIDGLSSSYRLPILFEGDLFHDWLGLSNNLLGKTLGKLVNSKSDIIAISGNHDQATTSTVKNYPENYIQLLSSLSNKWKCNDYTNIELQKGIRVHGVPYIYQNIGFVDYVNSIKFKKKEKNILQIHSDLWGAQETDGREVGSVSGIPRQMDKVFGRFDLVLSGHIHKPMQISSNVYMIGAPLQQRKTDKDCVMGYWFVYDDMSMEFVPLVDTPMFKEAQTTDRTDSFHYWTITGEKADNKSVEGKYERSVKKTSNLAIVKKYIEHQGINERRKVKALKNAIKKSEE